VDRLQGLGVDAKTPDFKITGDVVNMSRSEIELGSQIGVSAFES